MNKIFEDIATERKSQDSRWGIQNNPDGTGSQRDRIEARITRKRCDAMFKNGEGTWRAILAEEVQEAFAESDPAKLREELVQVASVAVAWCEAIDRRHTAADEMTEFTISIPLEEFQHDEYSQVEADAEFAKFAKTLIKPAENQRCFICGQQAHSGPCL